MKGSIISFLAAGVALWAFLHFANLAIFVAWQSAFTHANVLRLTKWFYGYCGAAIMCFIGAVALLVKGVRLRKIAAQKIRSEEKTDVPHRSRLE
jgi:hypothetical protein